MNEMQHKVDQFLAKHLGVGHSGWPNGTGTLNKWLLIKEEFAELTTALNIHITRSDFGDPYKYATQHDGELDEAQVIKEICDLLYVVFNLCEELRIDIEPFFDVVHASNMTKIPAVLSPTRKIMKGPNYRPPLDEIKRMLEELQSERDD